MLARVKEQKKPFEFGILGGSLWGILLALHLCSQGKRVCLLEKEDFLHELPPQKLFSNLKDPLLDQIRNLLPDLCLPSLDLYHPSISFSLPNSKRFFIHKGKKVLKSILHRRSAKLSIQEAPFSLDFDHFFHEKVHTLATGDLLSHSLGRLIFSGCYPINHIEAESLIIKNGKVTGLFAKDLISGQKLPFFAQHWINLSPSFYDPQLGTRYPIEHVRHSHYTIFPSYKQTTNGALFLEDELWAWNYQGIATVESQKKIRSFEHSFLKEYKKGSSRIEFFHESKQIPMNDPFMLYDRKPGFTDFFIQNEAHATLAFNAFFKRFLPLKTIGALPVFEKSRFQGESFLLHPEYSWTKQDCLHAIRYQMARSLSDLLLRRIPLFYLDPTFALKLAPSLLSLFKDEFGSMLYWQEKQIASFQKMTQNILVDH